MATNTIKIEEMTELFLKELQNRHNILKKPFEIEEIQSDILEYPTLKNQGELEFLKALQERLLVLFEGLNNFDKDDLEARVELNIQFLQFALANIDERIKKLNKN